MTFSKSLNIAGVLALIGVAQNCTSTDQRLIASGTVEATDADLGFQIPGRLDQVLVTSGARVQAGDRLAQLDVRQLEVQRRSANALVAMARARLSELETGSRSQEIARGRAGVEAALQRRSQAEADLARTRTLFEGGALAREVFDHQETAFRVSNADYDRSRQTLTLLEEGPRPQQIAAARASLEQALATVEQVEVSLEQAQLTAPFAGLITTQHREAGEIVSPGAPVVTIMNPEARWIRIYVRQDAIGRISIGQAATITADSYPDRRYPGEVYYISDEAEFTPRNVQTTEERVKLVFEVRVRITDDPSFDLKPGLPADVDLEPAS